MSFVFVSVVVGGKFERLRLKWVWEDFERVSEEVVVVVVFLTLNE